MEEAKELKEEKKEFKKFSLDGVTYKTILTEKWMKRKPYMINDPGKILSFIPGTVKKVFVKEGQTVIKGEKLLILEAMKMNNLILAPIPGKITGINVDEGEKVANHYLLVQIKENNVKAKNNLKKKKK